MEAGLPSSEEDCPQMMFKSCCRSLTRPEGRPGHQPLSARPPCSQPACMRSSSWGTRDLGTSDFGRGRDVGCRTLHEVRATASALQAGLSPAPGPTGAGRQGEGRSNTFLAKAAAVGPRQGGQALCRCVCREPASASAPRLPAPGLQQHLPFARRRGSHPIPRGRLMSIVSGGRTTKASFRGI